MMIADLHCDLLSFLAENPAHTIQMPESRASYSQMKKGSVAFQALAIFTHNKVGSFAHGKKQLQILKTLLKERSDCYKIWDSKESLSAKKGPIYVLPAFENASGFAEQDTPLKVSFSFLEEVLTHYKRILYISLTWDGENRFGGGAFSKVGLKEDGKHLLDWMSQKNIALDFSHTSDYLAEDMLNYIDKKSLVIPVLASHSNARAISQRDRNLPDFLIKEILVRKGVIGLNLFAPFIGKKPEDLALQVEHFFHLGAEKHLCFGADFFYEPNLTYLQTKYQADIDFFPKFASSACYPSVLALLQENLSLSQEQLQNLSYQNMQNLLLK